MADREDRLADVGNHAGKRNHRRRGRNRGGDANVGEVAPFVALHDAGEQKLLPRRLRAVGGLEPDGHPVGTLGAMRVAHDVLVGHDVAMRRDDDAGAHRFRRCEQHDAVDALAIDGRPARGSAAEGQLRRREERIQRLSRQGLLDVRADRRQILGVCAEGDEAEQRSRQGVDARLVTSHVEPP